MDLRILRHPQFDGSILVLSSDLLKNGVNVPRCILGHAVDDTSMMQSCRQIMGEAYFQFIVKNILKVHNRQHPKKRLYALDMNSDRSLAGATHDKKGDWFYKKGDYRVSLSGESHLEEAQDVYYESWCGNLDVRKKFKDSDECELEVFLENSEDEFSITDVQSDLQFVIPREDYPKLKEMFK